jgi:hypothetical protein
MADQAINALSTKTTPETSDQLLLVGAGEPQLIDYDKLADSILNKITSKNYALDAGQMTLLAALNKLNSESFNNGYNLNLTDWNSISAPGIYSGNGSDAKNSPSYSEGIWINAIAFASNGNKNYITIIAFYGLHISVKTKAKETWSGWELLV